MKRSGVGPDEASASGCCPDDEAPDDEAAPEELLWLVPEGAAEGSGDADDAGRASVQDETRATELKRIAARIPWAYAAGAPASRTGHRGELVGACALEC
jgi:hypothetical protein